MTDVAFLSAGEVLNALKKRKIGCLELLDHLFARMESHNSTINAVVATDPGNARARAKLADDALKAGTSWGPLHGLPVTVKDCFEVVRMPATGGNTEYADHVPAANAPAVQRLVDAGAIVIGKTNLPERASHHTANDLYGVTRNPWNTDRSPGGSSGGSAAAVAAGLSFLDLATDNGGSIRGPAHHCGVYGHKPSFGLIPTQGQVPPIPSSRIREDITVAGPLARSAEDLHLALDALSGPDTFDCTAYRLNLPAPRHVDLRGWRVAAWLDDPCCPVDSAVSDCLEMAVRSLADAGVVIDVMARPGFDAGEAFEIYLNLIMGVVSRGESQENVEAMNRQLATGAIDPSGYQGRYVRGAGMRYAEGVANDDRRIQLRYAWRDFFRDYDVLLAPAMPTTALPHDHDAPYFTRTIIVNGQPIPYWDQLFWAGLFGVAYLPSTVAPIGLAKDGLPVGIQIVGPYLEDRSTIAFAQSLADVLQGFSPPPGFA